MQLLITKKLPTGTIFTTQKLEKYIIEKQMQNMKKTKNICTNFAKITISMV
jgi:hypothetical protein